MDYQYDVIISYCEADNKPIKGGEGWITSFSRFLSTLLNQITKDTPKFHLITESSPASDFELAPIHISILSPDYVQSKNLLKGAEGFCKHAESGEGIEIGGVPRLFKVVKFPGNIDAFVPDFEKIVTYDFFLIDSMTGEAQEFKTFFGHDAERSFWMKLVDLAYDINHLLIRLDNKTKDQQEQEKRRKDKTIYLASTGVDMVIQRDIIKRELIRHGYRVLPEHSLPKEVKSLENMVNKDLRECQLSIHIVGEDYGYRPRGSEFSVVDIQNKVADKYTYKVVDDNKKKGSDDRQSFSRLIWISPNLKNVSERQKIFIEDLKSEAALIEEAEVLQVTLPEFKSIIRDELTTGGRYKLAREIDRHDEEDSKREDRNLIYLICNKQDIKASDPLIKYLEKEGFEVLRSAFEGDLVDLRYLHQENLRRCDASIIYYGDANAEWIRSKMQDVMKAPGFGRKKPIKAKALFVEGQKEIQPQYKDQAMILSTGNGFEPESVKPFLSKLKQS
ncbi:MAG: DUF4062 domain-containing protein [Cyclobacteriaceae bacterium]